MKRYRAMVALLAAAVLIPVGSLAATAPARADAGPPGKYVADRDTKIDVMGEWAHPDDDTSIIGPCGVWHQRYGTKCGIIMVTRGEGGGNSAGTELGPDLGLRRENEDRVAHYRSGTVDIFNLDRVDFFYNQSAPLTQYFWDSEETLRRVTRVIRTTQPEIYVGFTPTLAAGHGNHQQAGRLIWEGVLAAADPTRFPEQLTGPNALSTWQVKKVFSGGSTAGAGGTTTAANCTTGFIPTPGTNLDTVAGVWTGYDSPYKWPAGNLQGKPAGSAKIWQQVADEGRAAYPTQSRVMYKGDSAPACSRFGMTQSFVPFQPNTAPDGTANAKAGLDDAILFGATKPDPGGLPKGTIEYLTFSRFLNVAGEPFQATLHLKSGDGWLSPGQVALTVPPGWTVSAPQQVGWVSDSRETTVTFTVTPSTTAPVNQNAKISALYTSQAKTGYTDNVVRIVSPIEGRFQRWGNWQEYDQWLADTAPQATRLGRSAAIQSMAVGTTLALPVVVHNWSNQTQSGEVGLTLPANFTADAASKPYAGLAPGAETTVTFEVTNTDAALPATQNVSIPITTSYSAPAGSGSETLTLSLVPATAVANASTTPVVDGTASPGEYSGPTLDLGRVWQGAASCTGVDDCGVSATGEGSTAKVSWSDDALYFFVHIRDDYQSYAVTPEECVGHWQADSVEILIDPRGTASQVLKDTANTFKLGIFPFTNDPANRNGNGANGPCWERDADNHQGYSTGPLSTGNAPGVQVASTATWVGSNETTTPHAYTGGGYDLEVKIPLADLPAAVDPAKLGLNITPYDNDDTSAAGTTTLRHIDMSTRLGWSALGSVQSDPYRWGQASLPGYTPPADRPTTPAPPNVSNPNLNGVLSPQTIAQSARNDVPISGRIPAPAGNRLQVRNVELNSSSVDLDISAGGSGTARLYLWTGLVGAIPVYTTSCSPAADPAPDYGLTACAVTDGGYPPWSPDMSGHVVKQAASPITSKTKHLSIPITAAQRAKLLQDGRLLLSYETTKGEVQALDLKFRR
ncbi:carbohydrate binding protein with CBM9 domain [Kribbella sp. VKM Ac-2527]|uniref:Carbohydrate binding protein with CBM9 domain n=1 Tax=Kribbella caucasensis TaxID=2512215 RepID=A0A4R6K955_9ACTN|nr:PIG-L family deacetylase [Kribbella sp. VKM Ac-2527]TDO46198.1 carbohydrate binding protein with CBM9 domain [Kribbella sp. VKM Ac-2527]